MWPDPPNDGKPAHQGQIFKPIHKEWETQVTIIKEAAAAEAEEEDKVNDAVANKDDSKPATLKPRQSVHGSKKKKKEEEEEPSKRTEPLDYYFGPSQSQNNQETADSTPVRGSQTKE